MKEGEWKGHTYIETTIFRVCESTDIDLARCNICNICEVCNGVPVAKLKGVIEKCESVYFIGKTCDNKIDKLSDISLISTEGIYSEENTTEQIDRKCLQDDEIVSRNVR